MLTKEQLEKALKEQLGVDVNSNDLTASQQTALRNGTQNAFKQYFDTAPVPVAGQKSQEELINEMIRSGKPLPAALLAIMIKVAASLNSGFINQMMERKGVHAHAGGEHAHEHAHENEYKSPRPTPPGSQTTR